MLDNKTAISKSLIPICVTLLLLFSQTNASSQPEKNDSDSAEKIVFVDDFDPPGDDKPKDTGAGGSRDGLKCNANEQSIRALMPPGNFGLTTNAQPNIYLYLPETSAKQVVFSLQNEAKTVYKRAFLPIETNNNIARFSLPKNKINLEAGKNYQWKISIICDEHLKPGDLTFTGWLQKVEPTEMEKELASKSDREQINLLAKQGYWYDLLDAISLYAKRNPSRQQRSEIATDNLLGDWQQVLKLDNRFIFIDTREGIDIILNEQTW